MTFKRLWVTRHGGRSILGQMLSKEETLDEPYKSVLYVRKNSMYDYNCILKNQHRVGHCKIALYDEHKMHIDSFFRQNPSLSRMIYCNQDIFDLVQKCQNSILIRDTYMDSHPLNIYYRLCTILNYQPNAAMVSTLTLSQSKQQYLRQNVFYPQIKQLNKRVFKAAEIKLKFREKIIFRDGMPPEQDKQRQQIRSKWEQMIDQMDLQAIPLEEQEKRILQSEVTFCTLGEYVSQKPKLTSYAPIMILS